MKIKRHLLGKIVKKPLTKLRRAVKSSHVFLARRANRYLVKPLLQLKHKYNIRLPKFVKDPWFLSVALSLIVILAGVGYRTWHTNSLYRLATSETKLLSKSSVDKSFIKEDKKSFSYSRSAETKVGTSSEQVVAGVGDGTAKLPYNASLAKNPKDGVTFSDEKGERSVTMTARYPQSAGRYQDGRVMYPSGSNEISSYTFKRNGLKQDIIISKPSKKTQTFVWDLKLTSSLEARMLPDGGVGIYAADNILSGDITISDKKSQDLIDNARKNSAKTVLVFQLPKPFMIDQRGVKNYEDLTYRLNGNTLSLEVRNLLSQKYPINIDPTIVVTTTSDFRQGVGDSSNTDYTTANQITFTNSNSTSALNTWAYTHDSLNDGGSFLSGFTTGRNGHASVAYNGYLYVVGGFQGGGAYQNDVQYAPINADGTIGTWAATTSFTTARNAHTSVAYNGYLYVVGGYTGSVYLSDVQYAAINANGTIGTWTATTSFTTARNDHTSVAYNGYLYVVGGYTGSVYLNDVQYAPINADGTTGTWTASTSFTTARNGHASVAYNGYLYVVGGYTGSVYQGDVQYAAINADGTIGTWTATTSFTTGRTNLSSTINNGYLYIMGGYTGSTYLSDVQYAQFKVNGSLGGFVATSSFTTGRFGHASVAYNGYLYVIGGSTSGPDIRDVQFSSISSGKASSWANSSINQDFIGSAYHGLVAYNGYLYKSGGMYTFIGSPGYLNDVQYAPINANGTIGTWAYTHDSLNDGGSFVSGFTTARFAHTSVAYNGYLYIIGGCTNDGSAGFAECSGTLSNVQYAAINANGTIGTWTATSSLVSARFAHTSVVYNGFVYVMGGCDNNCVTHDNGVQYAQINSNGTIGDWMTTTSFTTGRYKHSSVVYNGYVYIIAGCSVSSWLGCSTTLSDVQYALICTGRNSGTLGCGTTAGRVGTWTATTSFSSGRYAHTSVAYNGYIYTMGNEPATLAIINSNGTIGTWTATTTIVTSGLGIASAALEGYIYLTGGLNGGTYNNVTQYANVGPTTNFPTTWTYTTSFSLGRYGHASVAYNGYLYVIGGYTGAYKVDVQYAPINANGTIGTWTATTSFTTGRFGHSSVVYNGYLYIMGGFDGTGYRTDVQYAPINANGTIGTWTATTSFLSPIFFFQGSVAYNGYLYLLGGEYFSRGVQYAPINANGTIGTWTPTTSFIGPGTLVNFIAVTYNGYLYVVGGCTGGGFGACVNIEDKVQYAPINANGTIGTWTATTSFSVGRYAHTSVAYNGYLYVIGGCSAGSYTSCVTQNADVQYAPINANGTIGTWIKNHDSTIDGSNNANGFTTARSSHTSVAYNGYIYVMGGLSGFYSDVQYFIAKGSYQRARYERFFDTGSSGNTIMSFVINGTTTCNYSVTYKTAGSSAIFGASTVISGVLPSVSQTITTALKRYVYISVSIDDSRCADISTITDIRLTYNGAPDAPTLFLPANNATNVAILPEFRVGTSDDSDDYIRYKIEVYGTASCASPLIRTIDQTSSQTGWQAQASQSATAYTGGVSITQLGIHAYQPSALSPSTQYFWRAYAIDPGGTNQWSVASSCYSFTTGIAVPNQQIIRGNTIIKGNTIIY